MALNIKNARVHALAREAAERSGTTQVSAIEAALERYLSALDEDERQQSRVARVAWLRAQIAALHLTEEDRELARRDMESMYDDELGLPR